MQIKAFFCYYPNICKTFFGKWGIGCLLTADNEPYLNNDKILFVAFFTFFFLNV